MTGRRQLVPSRAAVTAVAAIILAGCARLPQDVRDLARTTRDRIAIEHKRVDNLEKEFAGLQGADEFAQFEKYAARERWSASFTLARAKLKSTDDIYSDEVQPILDRDSAEGAFNARQALAKIPPLLTSARESAERWTVRRDMLAKVAQQPDQVMKECSAAQNEFKKAYPALQARAAKAKGGHSARAEEIDRMTAPLGELVDGSAQAAAAAAAEHRKLGSGRDADLALLGDSCATVRGNWEEFRKSDPSLQARLAELDRSYSRTLIDMKAEYGLVIRRQSWDDSLDYPRLHNTDFRVANMDTEPFEGLVGVPGSLASLRSGWFGPRLSLLSGVDERHWAALGIDPVRQWPSGDNTAEFWVEKAEPRYFHKYLVQENGETTETGWTEVSEDLFLENIDNLGMDVESKPYGAFESERLTHAAPPGMAFVGNPHYGRWVSDGRGGSVWSWIGPYLFYRSLFGSPLSYGRRDWNAWDQGYRGSRPYYGGTTSSPRWGTRSRSVQTSPKMQGSTFARGGGFRRATTSVRGAGPVSRGGSFRASGK